MIDSSDLNKVKTLIKKENSPIIVKAQSIEFNRKILEYGKFDILLSIELTSNKNSLRSIDSGFNEVLGKIASKNKIALGIDLQEIKSLDKKEKGNILSKIAQNIMLCRKTKTKIAILNYKNKMTALSFLLSLGASSKQAKEALAF